MGGTEHPYPYDSRWRTLVDMIQHRMDDSAPPAPSAPPNKGMTMHKVPAEKWNEPWQPSVDATGTLQQRSIFDTIEENAPPGIHNGAANPANFAVHVAWWKSFILRNAFVPLLARLINIMLISCTLAIGIVLRNQLRSIDRPRSVGQSPLLTIIFSPPSILHAFFQIWLEYMTRPIGLWGLSSKLWYTAIEIVFTCLWSALLALAFDNYFTSTIACQANASPFFPIIEQVLKSYGDVEDKGKICSLQITLICLCMVSVVVYVFVFMITLFRIFYRVSPQM